MISKIKPIIPHSDLEKKSTLSYSPDYISATHFFLAQTKNDYPTSNWYKTQQLNFSLV